MATIKQKKKKSKEKIKLTKSTDDEEYDIGKIQLHGQ